MKTVLGLLLIALTTYADPKIDKCHDRAIDIVKKGNSEHFLSFEDFMNHQDKENEEKFYVPWATINPNLKDKKYHQFCSGSTYSYEYCGVTYYERSIKNGSTTKNPGDFLSYLKLYSHSKLTGEVTMLTMEVKLASITDYIFQVVNAKTAIKAYSQAPASQQITVPNEISETLGEPYALYYLSPDGKISIFVSCETDSPLAWVSAKSIQKMNEKATKKIAEVLTELHDKFGVNLEEATYITPFKEDWSKLFSNAQKIGQA